MEQLTKLDSAFIKIGDKQYNIDLSNNLKSATININIDSGKTSLEPAFILDNGQTSMDLDLFRRVFARVSSKFWSRRASKSLQNDVKNATSIRVRF